MTGASTFLVGLMVAIGFAAAQPATRAAGHWEGSIEIPGQQMKIAIDLKEDGKKWEGTIAVPVQGLKGFPLADIAVEGDAVTFAMKGVPGEPRFKGTLSKDGQSLAGDFSQGGGTVPFSLTRTGEAKIEPPPKSTPITSDIQGSWEGTLDLQGKTLRLIAKLATQADGTGTGTLVSVDQGGAEIPIAAVIQTGMHLKLVVTAIAGSFEGDLKDGQLAGTWTQGPGSWPLVLKRSK